MSAMADYAAWLEELELEDSDSTRRRYMAVVDLDLPATLTEDNAHELCTCSHDRGWHWNGRGACGDFRCCYRFAIQR